MLYIIQNTLPPRLKDTPACRNIYGKIGFGICLFFISAIPLHSGTVNLDEYLQGYNERAEYIAAEFDTSLRLNYYAVAAKYARRTNIVQADSMFLALLENPVGDMFWMFPVIGAYLHGKEHMSQEVHTAVRDAWRTYAPYRGDTENHWCLYYASLYLAAEQWPDLPGTEWFNGKSSADNLAESREYLIHWIQVTTTIGQGEFDSPDYLPEYVIPMILLAQFAEDTGMRKRGRMMADYLLADFAAEHLSGQYVGGFSRIYEPAVYTPLRSPASAFAFLYFGTGEPVASGWTLLPALSDYRLPEIIYNIAVDRDKPYVHRERKRVRNVIRFGDEINPPVYKYTYMTKDYAIGSLHGGILQPIQQHTWGIRFTEGRPFTAIFGLHPYWSGEELAMFFPQRVKTLVDDVVLSKSTYDKPDKWTGGSPYERTFQHSGTLIVLYDIPDGTSSQHISGFFPKTLEERILDDSGWIICRAGDTYIGWYPLREHAWIEEDLNWRLHSPHPQNGYVVETASAAEVGDFERFAALLRSRIPAARLTPGSVSVTYRTIQNDSLRFVFPDDRYLNDEYIDLSGYKLFDGPFLKAEVGSERLTIHHGDMFRLLDFRTLTVTE
jgi:hypothetical protein